MFYYCLKIAHIVAAALLISSVIYSCHLWRSGKNSGVISQQIQKQTVWAIIPLAMIQLATGFSMISTQHYGYSQLWIIGSVIGFALTIGSWFSFIYFLLLSQQLSTESAGSPESIAAKHTFLRRVQLIMLSICMTALLSMIFFMANKAPATLG